MWDNVKDSGNRTEFSTGSVRDAQEGKGRYDLLPWIALRRLAIHYENGARKYGGNNWRKGIPFSSYINSAFRHFTKWIMGWEDEDHLAALLWNIAALLETEEMIKRGKLPQELDDRYEGLLDDELWNNPPEPHITLDKTTYGPTTVTLSSSGNRYETSWIQNDVPMPDTVSIYPHLVSEQFVMTTPDGNVYQQVWQLIQPHNQS